LSDHFAALGAAMIARVILAVLAIGVLWTAIAFAGFGIYLALLDAMLPWGAAAVTALIFTTIFAIGLSVYYVSTRGATSTPLRHAEHLAAPSPAQNDTLVPALTQLAKEHPWLAVGAAASLGVADSMKKRA
jgi:hypothetical protein